MMEVFLLCIILACMLFSGISTNGAFLWMMSILLFITLPIIGAIAPIYGGISFVDKRRIMKLKLELCDYLLNENGAIKHTGETFSDLMNEWIKVSVPEDISSAFNKSIGSDIATYGLNRLLSKNVYPMILVRTDELMALIRYQAYLKKELEK